MSDLKYLLTPPQPELYVKLTRAPYWFALRFAALGSAQTQVSYSVMSDLRRVVPCALVMGGCSESQPPRSTQSWPKPAGDVSGGFGGEGERGAYRWSCGR